MLSGVIGIIDHMGNRKEYTRVTRRLRSLIDSYLHGSELFFCYNEEATLRSLYF